MEFWVKQIEIMEFWCLENVLYSWTILLKQSSSKLNKQQWRVCVFACSVMHLIQQLGGMKPLPYHCLYFIANSFQYLVSSSTELKCCPSESSIVSPQSLKLLFHFPPWKIKGSSIRTKAVSSLSSPCCRAEHPSSHTVTPHLETKLKTSLDRTLSDRP